MELQRFAEEIWTAEGPPVHTWGVAFPTRMIVVRLRDGGLWINSPIDVSADEASSLTALGPVRHLVAPTPLHVWRLERWHQYFPDARQWLPGELVDSPPAAWCEDLEQVVFRGSFLLDEIEFFHRSSHTLIVADFLQQYRSKAGHPFFNAFMKLAGVRDAPSVPIDIKLSMMFGKADARRSLATLLSWDFDRLIFAHGPCLSSGSKQVVQRAFSWLSR